MNALVRGFAALAVLLLAQCAGGIAAGQSPPSSSQYVGSNPCRTCHADIWLNFYKNPHYRSIASGAEPPERTGCEGCHGPASAHLEARGGKQTIRAFSQLDARGVLETCLRCHAGDSSKRDIQRSSHTLAGVACTGCHSIHRPASGKFLLARRQTELCYSCHADVRSQFSMPFKHRVNEGSVQCTDCHNPHGAASPAWNMGLRPNMVRTTADGEEPCLTCHADKRGPFAFEHPGVRVEGCETCHSPHGSTNPRLLRRPAVFTLCLECHNGAGSFGRQADGIRTQAASHNMSDPRYQNCTSCHLRIHGSNADPQFLR